MHTGTRNNENDWDAVVMMRVAIIKAMNGSTYSKTYSRADFFVEILNVDSA